MLPPPSKTGTEASSQCTTAIPFQDCLAKTFVTKNNDKFGGRTVLNHCQIVGEVAREILARMPVRICNQIFPVGSELAAAAHDIGKVSPTFQEKIFRGTDNYVPNSLPELAHIKDPSIENNWGGHAGVSQVAAEYFKLSKFLPEILGQHHGYSPQLGGKIATDSIFGGNAWQAQREALVVELKNILGVDWPLVTSVEQARAIAGLTSVADWVGSGPFFEDPKVEWQPRIKEALDNAGFVQPRLRDGLSFADIFGFTARDCQRQLIAAVKQPGVYILEAPMGVGKTEAALYVAYKALSMGFASGIYFALPTQLTSNKIHDRVNDFLKVILATECSHRESLLLHGNAWLKEMGEEGQPGGSWFNVGKRGILAPFAVGTVDQALMAVMNVKHGFVRTFGLVGKVVILDEVHSYDTYTGTIIEALVKTLKQLHCTVIILSATLTSERRQFLLGLPTVKASYPLISSQPSSQKTLDEIEVAQLPDINVAIHVCDEDRKAIEEVLLRAEQGQQVLWVENTVAEAQTQYRLLAAKAAEIGVDCGLLHSRFLKVDRETNERKWVTLFGKAGTQQRNQQGRVLVGTQVLEQSLDIDADFLVTRFCPTDMLLQRMGRLWRHADTVRPVQAQCEAWLLAPKLAAAIEQPEKHFGKTAFVYSPYVLCRSLDVWHSLLSVSLPSDIRFLIEATYKACDDVGSMATWLYELERGSRKRKGREQLQRMALVGLSMGGKTLPENKATTRHSEQETTDLLLLRSIRHADDKRITVITLLNGSTVSLPKNGKSLSRQVWRQLSAQLMLNTLQVAQHLAPTPIDANQLDWLRDYVYLGNKNNDESLLRLAFVGVDGEVLALDSGPASNTYRLNYDTRLGYLAEKSTKEDAE